MRQKLTQWKSTAGPRQTKLVKAAFSQAQRMGQSHIETNRNAPSHMQSVTLWSPFDEYSEVFMIGWEALGKKFDWTITRDNHKEIAELASLLAKELRTSLPETDVTPTTDDIAARNAAIEDRKQKEAEQAQKDAKEAERIKAEYPYLTLAENDNKGGNVLAAKNIRIELARAFPGQKFSVRSSSFSMGNDVQVGWVDGPTSKEVEAIVGKYQYGHFNGMEDIYEYNHSVFCNLFGRTKYANTSRSLSDENRAVVLEWAKERYEAGETFNSHSAENLAYQLLVQYSIPVGATVTGVEPTGETSGINYPHCFYRPVFNKVAAVVG